MNRLDVLLVNAPSPNIGMLYAFDKQGAPPLGLGYLGTYLRQKSYSVKILDMFIPNKTVDSLIDILKENIINIVGFSCTTETFNMAIKLAKIVKEMNSNTVVVFGGPHVSFEYHTALSNDAIDYIVINEGEVSLKELCDYCIRGTRELSDLKGVAYKCDGNIICAEPQRFIHDLDVLPIPDRSLFDDIYQYSTPATIITSRGCPGKCIFCASSVLSGGRYRMRSAQNVVLEFEYLKSLGFTRISILDDTMTASKTRLESICYELIKRKLEVEWFCESRVDTIDKEMLTLMKAAGLVSIQFGVESGSQNMLNGIRKDITIDQIHNAFKICKDVGVKAFTNMIVGLPNADCQAIEDSIKLAEEIVAIGGTVSWSVCTPFPGTPIWQNPEMFNIEICDKDLEHYDMCRPVLHTKYMTSSEIRNAFYNAKKSIDGMMAKMSSKT